MSWLQIIFWVITNLPGLVDFIRRIIHGGNSETAREAISQAIATGNRQTVKEAVHKCVGIGCAPELKG